MFEFTQKGPQNNLDIKKNRSQLNLHSKRNHFKHWFTN